MEEEQQQKRIESLCGCIDFQSVHVQGSKRLVGHKILSPRRFPLNGIICATCKGFAGGWVDVLSYRCHNFNNNDNNIIICILVVLSPFVRRVDGGILKSHRLRLLTGEGGYMGRY